MTNASAARRTIIAAAKPKRNKFTIPVFPHVKKFIVKHYRSSATIKVEEYNVLGKFVTLALRDNRNSEENNDQYRNRLTAEITIVLTKEQAELSPRLNKLLRVNVDMDRIFKDHLITTIHMLGAAGIPPYNACKMFLEYYDIDDQEYSLDAAYKFWIRYNQ
jgi:hypothetical protein